MLYAVRNQTNWFRLKFKLMKIKADSTDCQRLARTESLIQIDTNWIKPSEIQPFFLYIQWADNMQRWQTMRFSSHTLPWDLCQWNLDVNETNMHPSFNLSNLSTLSCSLVFLSYLIPAPTLTDMMRPSRYACQHVRACNERMQTCTCTRTFTHSHSKLHTQVYFTYRMLATCALSPIGDLRALQYECTFISVDITVAIASLSCASAWSSS